MNKITRNFAAATLSLSALMATTGYAAEPTQLAATQEELTTPDSRGYVVVTKNSIVFSGCTADNYRATVHFFLATTPANQQKLIDDNAERSAEMTQAVRKLKDNAIGAFEQQYTLGIRTLFAEDFVEANSHSALPLKLRQLMNMTNRALNQNQAAGSIDLSWRIKNAAISNLPDPSCVKKTVAMAP